MGQRAKGPDPLAGYYRDAPGDGKGADPKVADALEAISAQIESLKKPTGTRKNPARTCRDLALCHPTWPSGNYWIDPNQGCTVDAIEVWCDMKTYETCVYPKPAKVPRGAWYKGPSKHVWFGDSMKGGYHFTYTADEIQMQFLRLSSTGARQNITYQCKNSVAYYDAYNSNYKKALKIMGNDETELSAEGARKFQYDVNLKEDGCQSAAPGKWSQTVMEYKTKKTTRLPFIDIAPYDIGRPDQEFGVEIGPVCFK